MIGKPWCEVFQLFGRLDMVAQLQPSLRGL
jgi:hypothetical protein